MVNKKKKKPKLELIPVTEDEFDLAMYNVAKDYTTVINSYKAKIQKILNVWKKIEFLKSTNHTIEYLYDPNDTTYIYKFSKKPNVGFRPKESKLEKVVKK